MACGRVSSFIAQRAIAGRGGNKTTRNLTGNGMLALFRLVAGHATDGEVAQHERPARVMAVERQPDPHHQFRRREGLDDVVGHAGLQWLRDGLDPAVGGNEDHRQVGERRQGTHQFDAVGTGQHQAEHRERRASGLEQAGHLAVRHRVRQSRALGSVGERSPATTPAIRPRADPFWNRKSPGGGLSGARNSHAGLRMAHGERRQVV